MATKEIPKPKETPKVEEKPQATTGFKNLHSPEEQKKLGLVRPESTKPAPQPINAAYTPPEEKKKETK